MAALARVEHIFGLLPLTARDRQANTLNHLFSLATPRSDAPATLPDPVRSNIAYTEEPEESIAAKQVAAHPAAAAEPPDPAVQGFLQIAHLRDRQTSPQLEKEQSTQRYLAAASTRADAKRYLVEVRHKVESS